MVAVRCGQFLLVEGWKGRATFLNGVVRRKFVIGDRSKFRYLRGERASISNG